jgi:predicted small integral membrane protein
MDIAWMAWTWQTAIFFVFIAACLVTMTTLVFTHPETERHGVLRIPTTRGDRLFLSLLGSGFIHLIWIFFFGGETIATVAGIEFSRLWIASLISLVYAWAVFRWV